MGDSNSARSIFYERNEAQNNVFKTYEERTEKLVISIDQALAPFFKAIKRFAETGEFDAQALKLAKETNSESDQENSTCKPGRPRKIKPSVLAESTEENLQTVKIKKEKLSRNNQSESTLNSINSTLSSTAEVLKVPIKTEKDDMPAPNWIPPKKKGKEVKTERSSVRSTRTKGKKASVRDSDVVVQNTTITTINLSDTDESDCDKALQKEEKKTRSTRTKTKKANAQSDSGAETDSESTKSTKTRKKNKMDEELVEASDVEETRSTRTKTIRKGKKVEEEKKEVEAEVVQQETRSTRTKTIKKGTKDPEESTCEMAQSESTRSTRTKTKKVTEKDSEEVATTKDSNEIKEVPKPNTKKVPEPKNQSKSKRIRSDLTDEEESDKKDKKKSKSNSPSRDNEANATAQTVYEDAESMLGPSQTVSQKQLDSTYVAVSSKTTQADKNVQDMPLNSTMAIKPSVANAANSTVVIDKPQFNIFDKKSDPMFTDDESIEVKTPPKKAIPTKLGKEVFSPYEKTSTKKKVEAFEKLQNGREVSTKSKNIRCNTPSSVSDKAKMFTPIGSKFLPSSSSTSKISRLITHQTNSSSNDSLLAMKSAQKESRDRQRKQMEREQALKKKEAMLQAQAEAKKKLNEEKQLKAQQQRKALEADKQKQLEQQKQKEARLKQRELEREEHLRQQKYELEKKRIAQKKKLQEIQAQRQQQLDEQAKHPPIYMTTKPPRLPTDDCYDSDEENYTRVVPPSWCVGEYARTKQLIMLAAGEKIKDTLFCRHPQTPDLTEIFEIIDSKKLQRSSSALWREPPRYTFMPGLNDTRFSEDDELFED